jgi:repressor LexA
MNIGENIKKMRESLRYSQREFAELLGISQTAVSQYELGQKQPSLGVVNKILKFAKQNKVKIKLLDD